MILFVDMIFFVRLNFTKSEAKKNGIDLTPSRTTVTQKVASDLLSSF